MTEQPNGEKQRKQELKQELECPDCEYYKLDTDVDAKGFFTHLHDHGYSQMEAKKILQQQDMKTDAPDTTLISDFGLGDVLKIQIDTGAVFRGTVTRIYPWSEDPQTENEQWCRLALDGSWDLRVIETNQDEEDSTSITDYWNISLLQVSINDGPIKPPNLAGLAEDKGEVEDEHGVIIIGQVESIEQINQ